MFKGFWVFIGELLFKIAAVFYIRKSGRDAEKLKNAEKVLDNVEKANADADAFLKYKLLNRRK